MVLAEWRRALDSLAAAELLAAEGYGADAISRAYYAALHAAKAALQVRDVAAAGPRDLCAGKICGSSASITSALD